MQRWWAASGIASVGAVVIALMLLPSDSGGQSLADIAARYSDGREGYLRAAYVEALSVGLFVVFVAVLADRLRDAEPTGAPWATLVLLGGAVGASLQIAGYTLIATLAYRTAETGETSVITAVYDASSIMFGFAAIPLALFLAAASAGLRRAALLPAPLAWFGFAAAALSLVAGASLARSGAFSVHEGIGFIAAVATWLWVLATSIALVARRARTLPAAALDAR